MTSDEPLPPSKDQQLSWVVSLHRELSEVFAEQRFRGQRPGIRVDPIMRHWGSYDALDHEILISLILIQECPWWVVVEVLKHEIAHLFVHAAFPNAAPHGTRFKSVCDALHVADWARGATLGKTLDELRSLFDWRLGSLDQETEKYRGRLRKLLALANSTNEHEALVAMQRARELQDQHRLEELDRSSTDLVNLEITSGKQRHAPYEGRISSILMNHYHVEVVYIRRFCAESLRYQATIDIMGNQEDVLLAEYVREFLHKSAESLWQAHRKRTGAKGLRARNSFIRGLLVGFQTKLEEQSYSETPERPINKAYRAIILSDQRRREHFKRQRYPRLSSRTSSARVDRNAFTDGKNEGKHLDVRTPLANHSSGPRLLER